MSERALANISRANARRFKAVKLTKPLLRARQIFNSYNLASVGGGKVYISYREHVWLVHGIDFKTDPNGAWYHYGSKPFFGIGIGTSTHIEKKAAALEAAKRWASEHYGIAAWERDPFGDWQDARAMAKVRELLAGERGRS